MPARQKVRKRRKSAMAPADHAEQVEVMLRRERVAFAAKIRGARAVLGWSQRELGERVSLTQKSVYRVEQGMHDLRRSTVVAVEQVLKAEGIGFEDLPSGGFKLVVPEAILSKLELNAGNV
jgi:ribosome-binding protein aMBF1 (putative translation factor)